MTIMWLALCLVALWGCQADQDTGETAGDYDAVSCPDDLDFGVSSVTGCVVGEVASGLEVFLGIPFALPPTGDLRFARPVVPEVWEEPFGADTVGTVCVQDDGLGGLMGDEDCLSLNVFRPEGTQAGDGLPILFFTHGGSFTAGAGSLDMFTDHPGLAEHAVVVTHNYRLGPLGFFAHESLTREDAETSGGSGTSGNQGLFDTLLALEWTRDSAEAFGGDPGRVMVFGESAGGISTCALLFSPLTEGMFDAAIIQSGACGFLEWPMSGSESAAEGVGASYAQSLGCEVEDVPSCLRTLEVEEIFDQVSMAVPFPVVDGVFLDAGARERVASGAQRQAVRVRAGFVWQEEESSYQELQRERRIRVCRRGRAPGRRGGRLPVQKRRIPGIRR